MYTIWEKKSTEEIKVRIFDALDKNVDYNKQHILGVPASYLDEKVFYQDSSFLKDAPFNSTLSHNPNHIGCHTLGNSEPFFKGTHEIEKEVIEICAVDILKGEPKKQDGYIASGGTEANMQAIWVFRNYFQSEYSSKTQEICILCSVDSHYSMDKAANIFGLDIFKIDISEETRGLTPALIQKSIREAKNQGKKYFIVVCNMMTTMFGSVDPVELFVHELKRQTCEFKLHIDGAYGGFYYPFANEDSSLTFKNPDISSFTLDAHKMAQAPYGTWIFLIRKGLIHHVKTSEDSYIAGEDYTLIGSRSGANAIAVWMILVKNGPYGWSEKVFILQKRTEWMCDKLSSLGIQFYRNPHSNIITIKSNFVSASLSLNFGLVPDNHSHPNWYKIVIMEHVTIEKLSLLIKGLKNK